MTAFHVITSMNFFRYFLVFNLFTTGMTGVNAQEQKITRQDLLSLVESESIETYDYFTAGNYPWNFSILDPGFVLVPANGGVMMAGWDAWFLEPQSKKVMAVSTSIADTSVYVVSYDKSGIFLYKLNKAGSNEQTQQLARLDSGIYNLSSSLGATYLWGLNNSGWHLWRVQGAELGLKPLYHTDKAINDLTFINADKVLLACDSSLVVVGENFAPTETMSFDSPIDGVAIDQEGLVYASLAMGVLRINSLKNEEIRPIANLIHGPLKFYKGHLYIHWREYHQVVKLKPK